MSIYSIVNINFLSFAIQYNNILLSYYIFKQ